MERNENNVSEVIQAIAKARKLMTPVKKSGLNRHFGYRYATDYDWYRAVNDHLIAYDLVPQFTINSVEYSEVAPDSRARRCVVSGTLRIWHVSGQYVEVRGYGEGIDDHDKAIYKAITGMKKYLYALAFALPTEMDPEYSGKTRVAQQPDAFQRAKEAIARANDPRALEHCLRRVNEHPELTPDQKEYLVSIINARGEKLADGRTD